MGEISMVGICMVESCKIINQDGIQKIFPVGM